MKQLYSQALSSLYLHFPLCEKICNYCDFYKRAPVDALQKQQEIENFQKSLQTQYTLLFSKLGEWKKSITSLNTLYLGGGTPSFWGPQGAIFLKNFLKQNDLSFGPLSYEFTVECNPSSSHLETLEAFLSIGANRFSLGIQTLSPTLLPFLDRAHSLEQTFSLLETLRDKKLNFSVDLMIGLPFSHQKETKRQIDQEINKLLTYSPSHFSVYILTPKKNYPYLKDLPPEEWIEEEYLETCRLLKQSGYTHYEVSNFAKTGQESLHNWAYWNQKDVAALGISAVGQYFMSPSLAYRMKWKDTQNYELETLSEKELFLEFLFLGARTKKGLSLEKAPFHSYSNNIQQKIQEILEKWKQQQKGEFYQNREGENYFRLTDKGFLIMDSFVLEVLSTIDK